MADNITKYLHTENIVMPSPMEYYVNLDNPKEKSKFIDRVERQIRSSMEYRDYIHYLKTFCDLDRCAFFSKVNLKECKKFKIEIHHEPFTLYDIVSVIVEKAKEEGRPINALLIADEVMELHYENMVGLIPLSVTIHKLVHNSDKVRIPLNMVYGNYSAFLDKYEGFIPDELYDKLERKLDETKNFTQESFDAITRDFTYIEAKGVDLPQKVVVEQPQETVQAISA